jgi:hypothetical protein
MDETTAVNNINQPGNLDRFHLGISSDGTSCLLLFVDERDQAISCIANFAEFNAFIASLSQAAKEMSRRRSVAEEEEEDDGSQEEPGAINVASAAFKISAQDGCLLGSLIGADGEVVGIRMRPEVANEMTRAMLLTTPAASAC